MFTKSNFFIIILYEIFVFSAKYEPKWFVKKECEITGEEIWRFTEEYWKCKETQSWDRCPVLYLEDEQENSDT